MFRIYTYTMFLSSAECERLPLRHLLKLLKVRRQLERLWMHGEKQKETYSSYIFWHRSLWVISSKCVCRAQHIGGTMPWILACMAASYSDWWMRSFYCMCCDNLKFLAIEPTQCDAFHTRPAAFLTPGPLLCSLSYPSLNISQRGSRSIPIWFTVVAILEFLSMVAVLLWRPPCSWTQTLWEPPSRTWHRGLPTTKTRCWAVHWHILWCTALWAWWYMKSNDLMTLLANVM